MKRIIKTSLLFALVAIVQTTSFAQNNDISLKIGGNYFINCERTIVYGDHSILNIVGDDQTGRRVNFDIFSSLGTLDASLADGSFSGPNAKYYTANRFEDGFDVIDSRDGRVVLKILSVDNIKMNRNDLHVWADFYLPDRSRFQCTPDKSNVPTLQMMSGTTFKNNKVAIQLK
jgi:hypothetical protein